jgi:hypothetical protein
MGRAGPVKAPAQDPKNAFFSPAKWLAAPRKTCGGRAPQRRAARKMPGAI